ncbi:MAG TPA: hypothetical protein VGH24_01415 [Solirubrobacteraceae bacterium]|jgi:hypothetical protein
MAAVRFIAAPYHEPPETTAPDPEDAGAAGVSAGCWMPPPLLAPEEDDDEELADDCVFEVALVWTVRPWNDFAATTEINADRATAPAIIQRLMREISASPRSRAVTGSGSVLTARDDRPG